MNPTAEITVRPNSGVVRQDFGSTELSPQLETAAAAVAAREQALVHAKFVMAMQRPRNIEQFRVRLEAECKRPDFAKIVKYSRPAGREFKDGQWVEKKAEGPTIRFVETALQCFGNSDIATTVVYDSREFRIVRASVMDLERNITYTSDIPIMKQVERRGFENRKTGQMEPPKGRDIISERLNTDGEKVYLVAATDDETITKQNALQSKNIRTNGLRLLPRDIVDRCMSIAADTVKHKDAQDPEGAKREIVDHFAAIGVQPVDLAAFLGHALDRPFLPAELDALRGAYAAVKEGEATWSEIMEGRETTGSAELQEEVKKRKLAEAELEAAKLREQQQKQPTEGTGGEQPTGNASTGPTEQAGSTSQQQDAPAKRTPLKFGQKPEGNKQ